MLASNFLVAKGGLELPSSCLQLPGTEIIILATTLGMQYCLLMGKLNFTYKRALLQLERIHRLFALGHIAKHDHMGHIFPITFLKTCILRPGGGGTYL